MELHDLVDAVLEAQAIGGDALRAAHHGGRLGEGPRRGVARHVQLGHHLE